MGCAFARHLATERSLTGQWDYPQSHLPRAVGHSGTPVGGGLGNSSTLHCAHLGRGGGQTAARAIARGRSTRDPQRAGAGGRPRTGTATLRCRLWRPRRRAGSHRCRRTRRCVLPPTSVWCVVDTVRRRALEKDVSLSRLSACSPRAPRTQPLSFAGREALAAVGDVGPSKGCDSVSPEARVRRS